MDWQAVSLSIKLAGSTVLLLVPIAIVAGRTLAYTKSPGKFWVEAGLALPLVLPPTVLGFYLLVGMGGTSSLGRLYQHLFGETLVFSFAGLLVASVIFNLPFAIQPVQRAFEAIPQDVRDAAACCGMSWGQAIVRVELPLAWSGILSGAVLTVAHTLGEFGVVLMVGGSIPGETRTIAIAIYDRAQAFDYAAANGMSLTLLAIAMATIAVSYGLGARVGRRRG
jgi:molybdate transport system permease protein